MAAIFLTLQDLYSRVPANKIRGYLDDTGRGQICDEDSQVQDVLMAAEGELYTRLLRAYPGDVTDVQGSMQKLIDNDPTLRMHVAWVACEFACERRVEFCDAQGRGAYITQFERAITYFENLSKGILKSPGDRYAGLGATTGGQISGGTDPTVPGGQFIFAPSRFNPGGPGGF